MKLVTVTNFAALLLVATAACAAPDEELLGKGEGYPLCKQAYPLEDKCLVGTLSHFDQIVPARIVKAGAAHPLKRAANTPRITYRNGDLDSFLAANRNTGLLVLRDDTIVAERYQYDRKAEDRFQSYSMAKTVVAMLVGIAVAEKKIGSLDDLVQQYVPALKGNPYGETRLRDLLTMSSGMNVGDESALAAPMFRKTLFREGTGGAAAVTHLKARAMPAGTKFLYSSTDTEVLALALGAAVGRPLADYLAEKIWQPMGAEADATWLVDGGGHELGYMGINATLRDWGRLGLLLANNGALDGRQIVPAAWVRAMTSADAPHLRRGAATRLNGYGYQTWLIGNTENGFALLGVRGQAVYVDPDARLVMVHTAVHADSRDPSARSEQFALFFGALKSLKDL